MGPFLGPTQLRKDDADHEGLDEDPGHTLTDEDEDGVGTGVIHVPGPVPNRVLGLEAEEEDRGEAPHAYDAG